MINTFLNPKGSCPSTRNQWDFPREYTTIYDPACCSGGLLIKSMLAGVHWLTSALHEPPQTKPTRQTPMDIGIFEGKNRAELCRCTRMKSAEIDTVLTDLVT